MTHLERLAKQLRLAIVALSSATGTSHVGSCLSCADILVAAYNGGLRLGPECVHDPCRDRLVFSKGHCAAALYCALAQRGFFPMEELTRAFNQNGGLQEHPHLRAVAGVEISAGSLGHGLSLGLGMALASRVLGAPFRVCVIMGDGEADEGSVWEAALLAGARKLSHLCVIVDANGWQATGRSGEIMALEPLADKWRAFGWKAVEVDGHNPDRLKDLLATLGEGDAPLAIVARTVKGKGVSFMEDDNNWHYRIPSEAEVCRAREELGL